MTTRVVAVDPDRPDPLILDQAAAILRSGGLVAFGTETVYGLGADATNPAAVARIFAAKGRPATNPLIVHVADVASARSCAANWPEWAENLADRFWPGPLTLVLPRAPHIPNLVTAGQETVGVRVPASIPARALIAAAGRPVAAPSANRSNRISPTSAAHVLKDLDGDVDLILDSGPCAVGIESTVLDLSGPVPTILRPGTVTAEAIAAVLGGPVAHLAGSVTADRPPASPGQLAVHYAPTTPAVRVDILSWAWFQPAAGCRWGLLVLGPWFGWFDRGHSTAVAWLETPVEAAADLYAQLHDLDAQGFDLLVVVTPLEGEPGWDAVLDRVRRATRPWIQAGSGEST